MQVLAINKRVQAQNNAPPGFPNFVRQGYEIAILADDYQESEEGLIWKVGNAVMLSCAHGILQAPQPCLARSGQVDTL